MAKTKPSFEEEKILWNAGYDFVIGIDEVGRGAFAGPIVAAGVIFKPNFKHPFLRSVNDSKLIKSKLRENLSVIIKQNALFWAIESVDLNFINKHGIGKANTAVFRKVLKNLFARFENDLNHFVLIDGFHRKYLPGGIKKQKGIVKGDRKSLSIAAASIIAKVERDKMMWELSSEYPNYGFGRNKGYGTREHQEAIREFGLSNIHRKSFNLRQFMSG